MEIGATDLWFVIAVPLAVVALRLLHTRWLVADGRAVEVPLCGGLEVLTVIFVWVASQALVTGLLWPLEARFGQQALLLITGVVNATIVGCLILSLLGQRGQRMDTLGLRPTRMRNLALMPIFYCASFICVVVPVVFLWHVFLEASGVPIVRQELLETYLEHVNAGNYVEVALFAANAVVVAPCIEELVFRGFFFGSCAVRWGGGTAAIVSSVIFALIHLSLSALFPLFAIGMILCYLRHRTGSLYISMLYHGLFNGGSLLLAILQERAAGT